MKESRQKITDFEKDHKEMLQQYEKLKGEWRNDRRKLFIMEGMMRAIPVVPIVIYKKDKKQKIFQYILVEDVEGKKKKMLRIQKELKQLMNDPIDCTIVTGKQIGRAHV